MIRSTHVLPLLAATTLLLGGCERENAETGPEGAAAAVQVAALPDHFVERMDVPLPADARAESVSAVFVDDTLRLLEETIRDGGLEARNRYFFFAGDPVLFRSRGYWSADGASHGMQVLAEFGLNGDPLGLEKRLDGEPLPFPPDEAAAIREHGRNLRSFALDAREPAGCDFNKSLRSGETLVTVIVPVGEDCDRGLLRLYARSADGSAVQEFDRRGRVDAAWLEDFDGDGRGELLVAVQQPGGEELLGWRIVDGRFTALEFGDLTPAQRSSLGGENRYRVEGDNLLRRYRSGDPARGTIRLAYNWTNERWLAEAAAPRDGLQRALAGRWDGPFLLEIPAQGPLLASQACGRLELPVLPLPGALLLVGSPVDAPDACDGEPLALEPGAWLAESNGVMLRLTGLDSDVRLEFAPAGDTTRPEGGSTDD